MVVKVSEAGCVSGQAVLILINGCLRASYHCAFEACVASHLEVKAAIACIDARLLGYRQVVSIDLAFAEVEIDVFKFLSDEKQSYDRA